MQTLSTILRAPFSTCTRRLRPLILPIIALSLAACGGGGGGGTAVEASCKQGLITGFGIDVGDLPIGTVGVQEGQGGSDGDGGDGAGVGDGQGIGIGGGDGQYTNVDVTVELASGRKFGPWPVDSTKGMVTYVHCGGVLPAKITFDGNSPDAVYYDEGLQRNVPFVGKRRIGLMTDYEKNVGVTPLTEALYERAMQIGQQKGIPDAWKDPAIVSQAHTELLNLVNKQLPNIYRLTDLKRLPVMLNATTDKPGSQSLPANANGIYGADVAAIALAGAATVPTSAQPAQELAETLIRDLSDGQLDLVDASGQPLTTRGKAPYTFDTLWSMLTVGSGETAARNGRDQLATDAVPIGLVRSRAAPGSASAVTDTLYVLGSNGTLVAKLNPDSAGAQTIQPAAQRRFSQLYKFGVEPVIALRRDGKGLLVFPTAWDGSFSFEVAPPSAAVTMVELIDAGRPIIRMSDGSLFRLEGANLLAEQAPVGTLGYSCRDEYDSALADGGNGALGSANGRVCYGLNNANELRVWRAGTTQPGVALEQSGVVQVDGNEQVTLALKTDGSILQLDRDHSVVLRDRSGNPVDQPTGGETRELTAPASAPALIQAPPICWLSVPFVTACDGTAYQLEYREYVDPQGNFLGAGEITGIKALPVPAPVWRPLVNRRITVGEANTGLDSVFVGTNDMVYDIVGKPVELPLDGAPQERPDQPPLAPTVASVANDDILDRNESQEPLTVSGTAQPGSNVTVTLAAAKRQTTADGNGRWQVTYEPAELPATDGQVPLEVIATNPNGSSTPTTRTVTVLRSLPDTPTINAVGNNNTVTASEAATGVSIGGTARAGSTVQVSWANQSVSTTADSAGNWRADFGAQQVPAPGTTQVSAIASNLNGASEPATLTVQVLPAPPAAPQIDAVTGDNVVSPAEAETGLSISGTATPDSEISVNWAGNAKSTTADYAGSWSVPFSPNEIAAPGLSTVTAQARNIAGASDVSSVEVMVQRLLSAPTINTIVKDGPLRYPSDNLSLAVSGQALPGSEVTIIFDGKFSRETTTTSQGTWNTTLDEAALLQLIGSNDVVVTYEIEGQVSPQASDSFQVRPADPVMSKSTLELCCEDSILLGDLAGTAYPGSTVTVLTQYWTENYASVSQPVITTVRNSAEATSSWQIKFERDLPYFTSIRAGIQACYEDVCSTGETLKISTASTF